MGEKPSISYHQSTGYHSYMFLLIQDHLRSTRIHVEGAAYCLTLDQLQRQSAGGSTRHLLKIARRRTAIPFTRL